ncbi:universal stress protein [Desulforapulum autotrophicum]|nr:universal stress protein [Desulforapulum autotrophicum]
MKKKLLVLVDGSERSIHTVKYVKDFMPIDDSTQIVLFHVFDSSPEWYQEAYQEVCQEVHKEVYQGLENRPAGDKMEDALSRWESVEQKKILTHLKKAKQILVRGGFQEHQVEIKFHHLEKGVAQDIIKEAKDGYTAVILRRRGMGKFKSIILGSVAVKLLQTLTFIPIIIVGQTPAVKKVLLAVDTSPCSMKAVDLIAQWLGGHGHGAVIFHAVLGLGAINFECPGTDLPVDLPSESDTSRVAMEANCINSFKSKIMGLFQNIRKILERSGFKPENISEKIATGVHSRSQAIIEQAEKSGCGTIVVGRRGLSRVEAFFIGRVGHKVVYGATHYTVWVV